MHICGSPLFFVRKSFPTVDVLVDSILTIEFCVEPLLLTPLLVEQMKKSSVIGSLPTSINSRIQIEQRRLKLNFLIHPLQLIHLLVEYVKSLITVRYRSVVDLKQNKAYFREISCTSEFYLFALVLPAKQLPSIDLLQGLISFIDLDLLRGDQFPIPWLIHLFIILAIYSAK